MFSKIVILFTCLSAIGETEASKYDVLPNVKVVPCGEGHFCRDGTVCCYRHHVAVSCCPVTHRCCGSGTHCCPLPFSQCCSGEQTCCRRDDKCCGRGNSAFCCSSSENCDVPNHRCVPRGQGNAIPWQFLPRTEKVNAEEPVILTEKAWPAGNH